MTNMVKKTASSIEVLVADDNAADVRLIREALKERVVPVHISVVSDGGGVLAFLRREFPYVNDARPTLILLDLQMPRKSGYEVLADIRADATFHDIRIVVFTSSTEERDRSRALALGAQDFCSKPTGLQEYLAVIQSVVGRWGIPTHKPPPDASDAV
jgi:two-component system, chemotaxis family, response regulator Rcp1